MEQIINDAVFGEMHYKYRWVKQEKLDLWGKQWDISVIARAYSGKPISDEQRESYRRLQNDMANIYGQAECEIINYINENLEELSEYWSEARPLSQAAELAEIVTPTGILFKQNGTTIFLLECLWDPEHGLGVQLLPELLIGSQDAFL